MSKLAAALSISPKPFNPVDSIDLVIDWQDLTISIVPTKEYVCSATLQARPEKIAFINANCSDISKVKVGKLNKAIFGYDLDIDPTTYQGKIVKKSNQNAAHDGSIIDAPVASSEVSKDFVYSKLINTVDGEYVVDFRVIYIGHVLSKLYVKRRFIDSPFKGIASIEVQPTSKLLSDLEVSQIEQFCHEIGVDCAELDVLRCNNDQRIYVVDVAKTPFGMVRSLKKDDARIILREMSLALARLILERTKISR